MKSYFQVLITGLALLLALFNPRAPKPQPLLQPYHLQYIQDTIQRPIPEHQIQIEIYQAFLPPQTIGQTFQINQDQYLILLNPQYREHWPLTILHELVHINQFKTRKLQYHPSTHQWTWLQRPIDWTLPWADRPWEQEADLEALKYLFWYGTTHRGL